MFPQNKTRSSAGAWPGFAQWNAFSTDLLCNLETRCADRGGPLGLWRLGQRVCRSVLCARGTRHWRVAHLVQRASPEPGHCLLAGRAANIIIILYRYSIPSPRASPTSATSPARASEGRVIEGIVIPLSTDRSMASIAGAVYLPNRIKASRRRLSMRSARHRPLSAICEREAKNSLLRLLRPRTKQSK